MRSRDLVSRATLDEWLTREIQQVPDCEGCVLTVKYRLMQPDDGGCNWSEANLMVGPNTNALHAGSVADRIVRRAREAFNLEDDEG